MPSLLEGLLNPRAARSQFVNPTYAHDGSSPDNPGLHPDLTARVRQSLQQQQPVISQQHPTSALGKVAAGLNRFGSEALMPTSPLGKLGAYLGAASGSPLGMASMAAMKDQRADDEAASEGAFRQAQLEEMQRKARMPRIETLPGGIVGTVNQDSGAFTPTFTAPTDAERYATSRGFQQGTPDWNTALQDFVLRGSGPTAHNFDVGLEGVRQQNREDLEGQRQSNRVSLRGQPTYAQTHPRPTRTVIGGIPAAGAAIPTVNTPADAMKLPSGTKFRSPDGKVRVRP